MVPTKPHCHNAVSPCVSNIFAAPTHECYICVCFSVSSFFTKLFIIPDPETGEAQAQSFKPFQRSSAPTTSAITANSWLLETWRKKPGHHAVSDASAHQFFQRTPGWVYGPERFSPGLGEPSDGLHTNAALWLAQPPLRKLYCFFTLWPSRGCPLPRVSLMYSITPCIQYESGDSNRNITNEDCHKNG